MKLKRCIMKGDMKNGPHQCGTPNVSAHSPLTNHNSELPLRPSRLGGSIRCWSVSLFLGDSAVSFLRFRGPHSQLGTPTGALCRLSVLLTTPIHEPDDA